MNVHKDHYLYAEDVARKYEARRGENQRELFERVEAAVNVAQFYCPDHKYNPPLNSGVALCPQCEIAAAQHEEVGFVADPDFGLVDVNAPFDVEDIGRVDGEPR
jgi:hypothetical protein